jgi:hypothetical protein
VTLKNSLGVSLDAIAADRALVSKLLAAAERNIADARLEALSTENRFDAGYRNATQCSIYSRLGA